MTCSVVQLCKVFKKYGLFVALRETSFEIMRGSMTCLIGPSGGGKTTLLQIIAAILPADRGEIYRFGEKLDYDRKWPNDSRIGYVFQENRLFPHLSAIENCTLALVHAKKLTRRSAEKQTIDLFEKLHIVDIAHKFPHNISGGQKQRVAIARTLVLQPNLLILDEVTSSLDPENIANLLDVIDDYHASSGATCIFSTHHLGFARSFADRILFLSNGSIIEDDSPEYFFKANGNPVVDQFLRSLEKLSYESAVLTVPAPIPKKGNSA